MPRSLFLVAVMILAGMVTGVWTGLARTELRQPAFASLVAIRDDATTTPFVYRRLLVDAAAALSRLWPEPAVEWLRDRVTNQPLPNRALVQYLGWSVDELPFVLSATFLIWASAAAVMLAARSIVERIFVGSHLALDLASLVPGLALVGVACAGTWHLYPYDIPQAAVFSIGLLLALRGSLLLIPWMILASYSKETSVLLIPAAWLVWPDDRRRQLWPVIGMGLVAWGGVQAYIRHEYHGMGNIEFWKLKRNAAMGLYFLVTWSWIWPIILLGSVRVVHHARGLPIALRKLLWLGLPLLTAAIFKGWVEELRQYSELIIPLSLCVYHAVLCEFGLARHLGPKPMPAVHQSLK